MCAIITPLEILIVEDDEPLAAIMVQVLRHLDVRVLAASNAHEALEYLEDTDGLECFAIITDQSLPGTNGTELLAVIAMRYPHLVRVVTTGWTTATVNAALECGCAERLLEKPWTIDDLARLLLWMQESQRQSRGDGAV